MSCGKVLKRGNGEDEGGGKIGRFDGYFLRVKGSAYGEEGLVREGENGVLDCGIAKEEDVGGVEVSVIHKFSRHSCLQEEEEEDEVEEAKKRHSLCSGL